MSRQIQAIVLFGTLAAFLYLVNSGIVSAESRIANGTPVYLELAPVDPRSLIQGDYMVLRYSMERDANTAGLRDTHRGQVVARIDENNVAHYDRPYAEGETLVENELLINYNTRGGGGVKVGVDSFFFQEGLGDEYAAARYAEVRITPTGAVMLIDLVGENFAQLAP
jgi:uncharacterized membrane-anchored protein